MLSTTFWEILFCKIPTAPTKYGLRLKSKDKVLKCSVLKTTGPYSIYQQYNPCKVPKLIGLDFFTCPGWPKIVGVGVLSSLTNDKYCSFDDESMTGKACNHYSTQDLEIVLEYKVVFFAKVLIHD